MTPDILNQMLQLALNAHLWLAAVQEVAIWPSKPSGSHLTHINLAGEPGPWKDLLLSMCVSQAAVTGTENKDGHHS